MLTPLVIKRFREGSGLAARPWPLLHGGWHSILSEPLDPQPARCAVLASAQVTPKISHDLVVTHRTAAV